ncbi:MAG: hypothetical protein JNL10_11855 [Verrucomicrobiales bacterium]|nr:hypothetical protein [Verrucomicrobiales bacterium]
MAGVFLVAYCATSVQDKTYVRMPLFVGYLTVSFALLTFALITQIILLAPMY